jgi:hypothetical protein
MSRVAIAEPRVFLVQVLRNPRRLTPSQRLGDELVSSSTVEPPGRPETADA